MKWPPQPAPISLSGYPKAIADWRDIDPNRHEVYETQQRLRLVLRLPEMGPVFGFWADELTPEELKSLRNLEYALAGRAKAQTDRELTESETAMAAAADEWVARRRESDAVKKWLVKSNFSKATT